jgi:hypothetical protein
MYVTIFVWFHWVLVTQDANCSQGCVFGFDQPLQHMVTLEIIDIKTTNMLLLNLGRLCRRQVIISQTLKEWTLQGMSLGQFSPIWQLRLLYPTLQQFTAHHLLFNLLQIKLWETNSCLAMISAYFFTLRHTRNWGDQQLNFQIHKFHSQSRKECLWIMFSG